MSALNPNYSLWRGYPPTVLAPPVTPTLAHFDASNPSSVNTASGFVTTWLSQLSGGAAAITGAGPITWARPQGKERGALYFTPNAYMDVAVSHSDATSSSFIVAMANVVSTGPTLLGSQGSVNTSHTWRITTGLQTERSGTAILSLQGNAAVTPGVPFVGGQVLTATDIVSYTNLVSETDAASVTFAAQNLRIGDLSDGFGNHAYFSGWIGEIIMYSETLSAPNAVATVTYLMNKWGIS